ncbi:hypothetical protein ATK36_5595 [Amycolatopsis sulphurea]|uniref:Uncharacterized protein n=1 Tax=Amycolatopsis sulphurea TaxID=76022 RepID=A0A2A9FIU9_9PSEU|nr:hypothetical protein ATK36_5595 [Amycolatopsis sulphurea]
MKGPFTDSESVKGPFTALIRVVYAGCAERSKPATAAA